jgi:hypothetical protein
MDSALFFLPEQLEEPEIIVFSRTWRQILYAPKGIWANISPTFPAKPSSKSSYNSHFLQKRDQNGMHSALDGLVRHDIFS